MSLKVINFALHTKNFTDFLQLSDKREQNFDHNRELWQRKKNMTEDGKCEGTKGGVCENVGRGCVL